LVSFLDAKRIANCIQLLFVALTDGIHVGVRVVLIDGNEFGSKSQTNDRNVDFLFTHKIQSIVSGLPRQIHPFKHGISPRQYRAF
jgi:hypothetical protein